MTTVTDLNNEHLSDTILVKRQSDIKQTTVVNSNNSGCVNEWALSRTDFSFCGTVAFSLFLKPP